MRYGRLIFSIDIYTLDFFSGIDGVTNALDNVKASKYSFRNYNNQVFGNQKL